MSLPALPSLLQGREQARNILSAFLFSPSKVLQLLTAVLVLRKTI